MKDHQVVLISDEAVHQAVLTIVSRILAVKQDQRAGALAAFIDIMRQTIVLAEALEKEPQGKPS